MNKLRKAEKLNLVLTGFMATGKTIVGEKLAERLNRRFIDTDRVIEETLGMTVRDIFELHGEEFFRDRESEALAALARYPAGSLVVATGGGALIREENRKLLKENGLLILLTAAPQEIIRRAAKTKKRPLLDGSDPEGKVKELLAERKESYSAGDLTVETTHKSVEQVVEEILEYLLSV